MIIVYYIPIVAHPDVTSGRFRVPHPKTLFGKKPRTWAWGVLHLSFRIRQLAEKEDF